MDIWEARQQENPIKLSTMEGKKTRYIKVRMTEEEVKKLKEKAADYGSVSHYIRCAMNAAARNKS